MTNTVLLVGNLGTDPETRSTRGEIPIDDDGTDPVVERDPRPADPLEHAQQEDAVVALEGALKALQDLYFPDDLVVCGSVGLSPWLSPHLERLGAKASPFGGDAGLFGAAALALFPGW